MISRRVTSTTSEQEWQEKLNIPSWSYIPVWVAFVWQRLGSVFDSLTALSGFIFYGSVLRVKVRHVSNCIYVDSILFRWCFRQFGLLACFQLRRQLVWLILCSTATRFDFITTATGLIPARRIFISTQAELDFDLWMANIGLALLYEYLRNDTHNDVIKKQKIFTTIQNQYVN